MFVNSSPKSWLADYDLSSLHLTHLPLTPYSKQNHCDVTIDLFLHYKQDHFLIKNVDGRQIAKKSPFRHADHKPNAGPPRDDTCVIWKESDQNCSVWKILKKSLLTT